MSCSRRQSNKWQTSVSALFCDLVCRKLRTVDQFIALGGIIGFGFFRGSSESPAAYGMANALVSRLLVRSSVLCWRA